jgi:hypothetical protein
MPVHAALVTRRAGHPGVLILGPSGQGKSSLSLLAISRGWRVVTDDLAALRRDEATGETLGATIRKRLRIPAHLLDSRTRDLGRRMYSHQGLQKIRLDPDALRPGAFLPEARIGCLVFLERGESRSVSAVSRTEALERLIAVCSAALSFSRGSVFRLLAEVARQARPRVARLTESCLTDPDVLEELAA